MVPRMRGLFHIRRHEKSGSLIGPSIRRDGGGDRNRMSWAAQQLFQCLWLSCPTRKVPSLGNRNKTGQLKAKRGRYKRGWRYLLHWARAFYSCGAEEYRSNLNRGKQYDLWIDTGTDFSDQQDGIHLYLHSFRLQRVTSRRTAVSPFVGRNVHSQRIFRRALDACRFD